MTAADAKQGTTAAQAPVSAPRAGRAGAGALAFTKRIAERECRIAWQMESGTTDCLDKREHARAHPDRYAPEYRARLLAGTHLCDTCAARDALAAGAPPAAECACYPLDAEQCGMASSGNPDAAPCSCACHRPDAAPAAGGAAGEAGEMRAALRAVGVTRSDEHGDDGSEWCVALEPRGVEPVGSLEDALRALLAAAEYDGAAARRDRVDAGRGEHDAAAIADLLDYCEASERYCETRDPAAATQWARRARALRALASPPQVPAAAVRDLERFNARAGAARDAGEG